MKTLFKKSLLVLMVAFIAVFTLGVTSKVKAEEEVYKTLTFTSTTMQTNVSSYTSTWKTICNGDTWNIVNANNNNRAWTYIKMGRKNNASVGSISTTFAIDKEITKVVMTVDAVTTAKINSLKLYVASDANFSNVLSTVTATAATGTVTFTVPSPVANAYYKLEADCASGTSNGLITISKVQYYASSSSEPTPSITVQGDSNAMIGQDVTLTATTLNPTCDVVWSSSDDTIATVANGVVTPVKMGSVTITAKRSDDETITAQHNITVYPNNESEITIEEANAIAQFAGTNYSPYDYTVSGTVKGLYNTQFGNFYLTDGVNEIGVYGLYDENDTRYDSMTVKPVDGNKIKISGPLGQYSSNNQFKNATLLEIVEDSEDLITIKNALNKIKSYMSLAFKYSKDTITTSSFVDSLNRSFTGITGTSYVEWSNKVSNSSALYAGNSAGGNESIQLRSNNSNSGIVSVVSGGNAKTITIDWNESTATTRTILVYGSNTAYTDPSELYNANTQGTLLCELCVDDAVDSISTVTIDGDYAYVGLRSKSGALYLNSVEIEWALSSPIVSPVYSDVDFRIKCGVDKALGLIDGVDSFGISVKFDGEEAIYSLGNQYFYDDDDECYYAIISLKDALNYPERLTMEFTVKAFVVVDGVTYESELENEYKTVADMVAHYKALNYIEVESLYNDLVDKGIIEVSE